MTVERFDPNFSPAPCDDLMNLHERGEYVRYEDYQKVLAALQAILACPRFYPYRRYHGSGDGIRWVVDVPGNVMSQAIEAAGEPS